MIFTETGLAGAFVIEPERLTDERGFFARSFCTEEFAAHGLDPRCAQCNISYNEQRGTLRGMHYQRAPHEEAKLVRCTAGAIYDVIVDLRHGSPTFGKHVAVTLTQDQRNMLFVPAGFAHGFQALTDAAEVFYQMSTPFVPGAGAGLRYDDPALAIRWPEPVKAISERDLAYPPFDAASFRL